MMLKHHDHTGPFDLPPAARHALRYLKRQGRYPGSGAGENLYTYAKWRCVGIRN